MKTMMSKYRALCEENGIVLRAVSKGEHPEFPQGGAFAFNRDGQLAIFYDRDAGAVEQEYLVAHELGHILLGHFSPDRSDKYNELEAIAFATVMTALDLFSKMNREAKA